MDPGTRIRVEPAAGQVIQRRQPLVGRILKKGLVSGGDFRLGRVESVGTPYLAGVLLIVRIIFI